MVEFGTSSAIRGWVRVRVLGYGSGVRGRKIKSRDCALASDLARALCLTQFQSDSLYYFIIPSQYTIDSYSPALVDVLITNA